MIKKIYSILLLSSLLLGCTSQDISESIVQIETKTENNSLSHTKNMTSSGVIIDKDTIITVAHGIGSTESQYIINESFQATLLQKYPQDDIALLQARNILAKKSLSTNTPRIGEEIFSYSIEGKKTGKVITISKNEVLVNIQFTPGESGGGIFNKQNELIGIIGAYDFEQQLGVGYQLKK